MRGRLRWAKCAARWDSWRHGGTYSRPSLDVCCLLLPLLYLPPFFFSFLLLSLLSRLCLYSYFFVFYLSVLVLIYVPINSFVRFYRSDSLCLEFCHSSLCFLFLSFTCCTLPTFLPQSNRVRILCVCVSQLLSQFADFCETWYDDLTIRGHPKAVSFNIRNKNNMADSAALTPST